MIIIQALRSARTEYVVYFLLSAWLEILVHNGRARGIATDITSLPVRNAYDVHRRLRLVREALAAQVEAKSSSTRTLQDAAAALAVACDKVRELTERQARLHVQAMRGSGRKPEWSTVSGTPTGSLEYAIQREGESHACLREAPFE